MHQIVAERRTVMEEFFVSPSETGVMQVRFSPRSQSPWAPRRLKFASARRCWIFNGQLLLLPRHTKPLRSCD